MGTTRNIRFLVMDVDGTLTDGKIYMGQSGELFKVFDAGDGYAIKEILPSLDIIPVIITARRSLIVENRAKELSIAELHQGCSGKLDKLNELLLRYSAQDGREYSLKDVAYIGDDILDLQCLIPISEAGGVAACPANAVEEVKQATNFICSRNGGNGAVRELIEKL